MSESEYEAFEVTVSVGHQHSVKTQSNTITGLSVEPIRVPPIVTCATGCGRPVLTGDVRCRECYEAEMAKRFRESLAMTKDKPITHY